MNRISSRQRKLLYAAVIGALLLPIAKLGMPATGAEDSGGISAGGHLARLRQQYDLGESNLGDVDPTSATMNLVLLGLRGVATNLLWLEADELKDTKNWGQLRATVESIIMLQPHFLKVWQFQGWNLAFNVSAEFDAVEDRWYWVKEGGKFIIRGSNRNRKYPELYWDVGNILGKKIGRSDEWRFFRRFFKSDPEVGEFGGESDPAISVVDGILYDDNYLAARQWFFKANEAEAKPGAEQHIMARILFRQYPVRAQLDYAGILQREGFFDEKTRVQWEKALEEWTTVFGKEMFRSPGGLIHLEVTTPDEIREMAEQNNTDEETIRHWIDRYRKMSNYVYWRERALAESEINTRDAHREIYEGQQLFKQGDVSASLFLAADGACGRLKELKLPELNLRVMQAICDAGQLPTEAELLKATGLSGVELGKALTPLIKVRKLVRRVSKSQLRLESGMKKFAKLLADHPMFVIEDTMVEEGLKAVLYWRYLLTLSGQRMPETFPLKDLWDRHPERIPVIEQEFKRESGT